MKNRGRIIGYSTFLKQRMKRQSGEEKRKIPRLDIYFAMPTLISANWAGGSEVELINISRRGALIDSRERMSPGSSVSLRFITAETTYVIKGQIARCGTSLKNNRVFQSAIAFEEDFTILPEVINMLEDRDFLK